MCPNILSLVSRMERGVLLWTLPYVLRHLTGILAGINYRWDGIGGPAAPTGEMNCFFGIGIEEERNGSKPHERSVTD